MVQGTIRRHGHVQIGHATDSAVASCSDVDGSPVLSQVQALHNSRYRRVLTAVPPGLSPIAAGEQRPTGMNYHHRLASWIPEIRAGVDEYQRRPACRYTCDRLAPGDVAATSDQEDQEESSTRAGQHASPLRLHRTVPVVPNLQRERIMEHPDQGDHPVPAGRWRWVGPHHHEVVSEVTSTLVHTAGLIEVA